MVSQADTRRSLDSSTSHTTTATHLSGLCGEWKVADVHGLDEFLAYKGASGAERKMSAKASANMVSWWYEHRQTAGDSVCERASE